MRISIIGCGNMGTAYARSFRKYGLVSEQEMHLVLRNEERSAALQGLGVVCTSIDARVSDSDLIILAIKPQDFNSMAAVLGGYLRPEQVVLSIMAGISMERLTESLQHPTIVRAMPNSPAQIGMGITAYATGAELSMMQTVMVEQLLNSTGRAVHLADESHLDAVTALSGSGPAYFFHIVQSMIDAGIKLGLAPHVANALVKQTMVGSYHLMEHSEHTPEELIKAVTSKGGTTEAAFRELAKDDVAGALQRAISAACDRATELAKS